MLICFMTSPLAIHVEAAKKDLCYIRGTTTHGILFPSINNLILQAFANSDWVRDPEGPKSTSRMLLKLREAPIS